MAADRPRGGDEFSRRAFNYSPTHAGDNGRRGLVVRWLVACPLPSSPVASVVVVCPVLMARLSRSARCVPHGRCV